MTGADIDFAEIYPTGFVPDRWYGILEARRLKRGRLRLRRFAEDLLLYRTADGTPHCVLDRCPHRGARLSQGTLEGDELVCAYHGFRFDAAGGCTRMPCEGQDAQIPKHMCLTCFPIRAEHGILWLWWGADASPPAELPSVPWFDDLPATRYSRLRSFEWPVPFHATVSTTFDAHHGPILHGEGSIRAVTKAEVTTCCFDERGGEVDVTMSEERPRPGKPPRSYLARSVFRAPGASSVTVGKILRIVAVDSPIDHARTFRMVRWYSLILNLPILGDLVAFLIATLDYYVSQLRQDRPAVLGHLRAYRGHGPREKWVGADVGITGYLKHAREQLASAERAADRLPPLVRSHLTLREPRS